MDLSTGAVFPRIAVSYLSDNTGLFIMGDTFLRNFVTSFDLSANKMVLGVNVHAPEGTKIEWKLGGWQIFGIVMACLFGVIVIAMAIYCCVKHQ